MLGSNSRSLAMFFLVLVRAFGWLRWHTNMGFHPRKCTLAQRFPTFRNLPRVQRERGREGRCTGGSQGYKAGRNLLCS